MGWFYEADGERRGPLTVEQMKQLVVSGAIRRQTRVWRPGANEADLTRAGDFLAELVPPSTTTNDLFYLLPIGRSGWAIAAGYVGLLSFLPFVCYVGLAVSSIAAWKLKRDPQLRGWGRVITGFVVSVPMSILYTAVFFFSRR